MPDYPWKRLSSKNSWEPGLFHERGSSGQSQSDSLSRDGQATSPAMASGRQSTEDAPSYKWLC